MTYYKISKKENLAHLELGVYFWAQHADINLETVPGRWHMLSLKRRLGMTATSTDGTFTAVYNSSFLLL